MCARMAFAYVETLFLQKKYAEAKEALRLAEIILIKKFPEPQVGPYPAYSNFKKRADGFIKEIKTFSGNKKDVAVCYGDSLTDMYRTRFDAIDLCLSCGGMHHYHMLEMAQVTQPFLYLKGIIPRYIMVGTLGGNPLLQRQEINSVINKTKETLDGLRHMFPASKFIVYGLPPVSVAYVIQHSFKFEEALYKWVVQDQEAVFIPMQKQFAGKWGVLPKIWCTAEGVHLSPVGAVLLDERFEKAKKSPARTIIDY